MKYKAVIFDFDYTLVDATQGFVISANYALKEMGFLEKTCEEIRRTIGVTIKDTFGALTKIADEELALRFEQLFTVKANSVMVLNTELFSETKAVLVRLNELGLKVGIVTNKYRYWIEETLNANSIRRLVTAAIGTEDVVCAKPNPEGLLKIIDILEIKKESVIYVGDSYIDAQTAKNAEVDFLGITTGNHTSIDFDWFPNIAVVQHLSELLNYIDKKNSEL